ncbi:UDP-glucose/GDP-mannose dehydrogenase family protein [bacterium C-53]|nr:UDP-glucose/GDP-mannose dehydrogenase family protein [Lachnospiraceae bacterium]NBI01568.1 UDP-glucose/GDP-mannose dehydrogenase family protein [Lachnospiraceae bacterium]RKJ12870.1 UDP-glucose/GDP-mannose dehydrogenase family protein [bacterium C-53]
MKIAVAGTGYVGLVTGVCLAENGHSVTCVDVDASKIEMMRRGISPIYEQGLSELMRKNKEKLTFTLDFKEAYADADVIFIGVGTPEKRDGSANLAYVYGVADQIAEVVTKECVVVVKSTVPIGTNDKIEQYFADRLQNRVKIHVASNPEFLAQGTAVRDTLHASRIVIGVEDAYAEKMLREVYRGFDAPLLVTNRRSAEMIKYASNDFLALKISYINEIANLCEIIGADIEDVTKGMSYDTRIGSKFLNAGIGYGGSCFPKDTKALSWLASYNDNEIKTIKAAIEVNESQKLKPVKKASKYYKDFRGLNVAVLGLTFKPGTDDLREAPSLVTVPILVDDGANIKAWDPVGCDNFKKHVPEGITYCETIEETLKDADICFIFTEWPEVKVLNPSVFVEKMRHPIVIDGRNCFSVKDIKGVPMVYESIGRAVIDNR